MQSADTVILYDPDFNPFVDAQASLLSADCVGPVGCSTVSYPGVEAQRCYWLATGRALQAQLRSDYARRHRVCMSCP